MKQPCRLGLISTVVGFLTVTLAATVSLAQTYTATPLLPPSGYYFYNLDGSMNNKGQVLGEVGTGFNNGVGRVPTLWTNGVPQILPIPSGYAYTALLSSYKVNEAGTVVGTVQESNSMWTHVVIWTAGVPTVLRDADMLVICGNTSNWLQNTGSSYSSGFNSAGHISGTTTYQPVDHNNGQPCFSSWFYDGNFHKLPRPIPPQCRPNQTDVGGFPILNDADQVVDVVMNYFCTNWPYSDDPVVMQPPSFSSYFFIPLGPFLAFFTGTINNVGMMSGCISCGNPPQVGVWDTNGLHGLGSSAYGHINNLGQVVYVSNPFTPNSKIEIWQNGTSAPIQGQGLPNAPPVAFNDAGQIAVSGGSGGGWLLTPAGPCATDVSSQVQVVRGGFRYNRTNQHFTQLITVTNTSGISVNGPISIAFDSVPAAASLFGVSGATSCNSPAGSPYVNSTASSLSAGASTTVTLDFIDTAQTGITYNTRIFAGSGRR